jgi:anti-sigma factor RsiW
MASLDSLPADQRAVIQLVLQRGRSYDDIASMLSIDRAAVRQRALDGFDALGPSHSIPDPQRALLTDYMLGQLPDRVAQQVRERLAASPPERAWLRVIASEITSVASSPLPEIPVAAEQPVAATPQAPPAEPAAPRVAEPAAAPRRRPPAPVGAAPTSRRGGAIVLGLAALIIAGVVIAIVVTSGGGGGKSHRTASRTNSTPSTTTSPSTTSTTSTKPKLLARVPLVPTSSATRAAGEAEVLKEGNTVGVVIIATGMPANSKTNAYAVWLANSSTDSKLVGFVNQRVGSDGKLETEGPLPANASHYKQMLVTLETQGKPKAPGPIVLEGSLKLS